MGLYTNFLKYNIFSFGREKFLTSISKILSILDLFTDEKSMITIDDIIDNLSVSVPTGYRYLKELCDSGLLTKISSNTYSIGPKIIKLDYHIRKTDPMINAGKDIMKDLALITVGEVLLSNIYNEDEIINIHSEVAQNLNNNMLTYSRGKPHPKFAGATAKIILAYLSKAKLKKIYEENEEEIRQSKFAKNMDEFISILQTYKKQGYVVTHGELDDNVTGVAAPIFNANHQILGCLTLVIPSSRLPILDKEKIINLVVMSAEQFTQINLEKEPLT